MFFYLCLIFCFNAKSKLFDLFLDKMKNAKWQIKLNNVLKTWSSLLGGCVLVFRKNVSTQFFNVHVFKVMCSEHVPCFHFPDVLKWRTKAPNTCFKHIIYMTKNILVKSVVRKPFSFFKKNRPSPHLVTSFLDGP